jgi:hypothetical protein
MSGQARAKRLSHAIDALADAVPSGHLLAATGGADLLFEAARLLVEARAEVARLRVLVSDAYVEGHGHGAGSTSGSMGGELAWTRSRARAALRGELHSSPNCCVLTGKVSDNYCALCRERLRAALPGEETK